MALAPVVATHLTTPMTRDVSLFIGGRDLTTTVKWDSLAASDNGTNGRGSTSLHLANVGLDDLPELYDRALLRLVDHADETEAIRALVTSRGPSSRPGYTGVDVVAADVGMLLDETFIPSVIRPAETMQQRIGFLWGWYAGSALSADLSNVAAIGGTLAAQSFAGVTLRQALEATISQASASADSYVDALGKLHVFESQTNAAPANVTEDAPEPGEVAPEDLAIDYDANTYANRVYIDAGTPAGSGFFQDDRAIADANGVVVTRVLRAPDCETAAMAQALANMYLGRVSNRSARGAFSITGTDGWRGGQMLRVRAPTHGLYEYGATVDATSTISSGAGATDWHGRAAIKRRGDGVLVLVYRVASAHDATDGALHIRFSNDNGATWTAADTKIGGGAVSGFPMNPAVGAEPVEPWLYLAPNGNLVLHMWRVDGVSDGTYQSTSTDGGATWGAAARVDFGGIVDDSKVFATDDDFVLNGVIYAAARVQPSATSRYIIFIKSTDNGATWSYVSDISPLASFTHEIGLEYVGDNTIVGVMRTGSNNRTYQVKSTDLGLSWSPLLDVSNTVGVSGRHRIYTLAHLRGEANWWADAALIMVGFVLTDPGNSHPRRPAVWLSPDRGAHWSGPHYLAASSEDGGYGDVFYDAGNDQWVVVTYYGLIADADLNQYRLSIARGNEFRIARVTTRIARPGASMVRKYSVEFNASRAGGGSGAQGDSLGTGQLVSGQLGGAANTYVTSDGVSVTS